MLEYNEKIRYLKLNRISSIIRCLKRLHSSAHTRYTPGKGIIFIFVRFHTIEIHCSPPVPTSGRGTSPGHGASPGQDYSGIAASAFFPWGMFAASATFAVGSGVEFAAAPPANVAAICATSSFVLSPACGARTNGGGGTGEGE